MFFYSLLDSVSLKVNQPLAVFGHCSDSYTLSKKSNASKIRLLLVRRKPSFFNSMLRKQDIHSRDPGSGKQASRDLVPDCQIPDPRKRIPSFLYTILRKQSICFFVFLFSFRFCVTLKQKIIRWRVGLGSLVH